MDADLSPDADMSLSYLCHSNFMYYIIKEKTKNTTESEQFQNQISKSYIVEKSITLINDHPLSWLGTVTSIKVGGFKLVLRTL